MKLLLSLYNLLAAKGYGPIVLMILAVLGVILTLRFFCWLFGILAMRYISKAQNTKLCPTVYIPGAQAHGTLLLDGKDRLARRSAHLIWWLAATSVLLITAIVWYYNGLRLQFVGSFKTTLLIAILSAVVLLVVLYVQLRINELKALKKMLPKKAISISIFAMCFFVPLHRIYLYTNRKKIAKE